MPRSPVLAGLCLAALGGAAPARLAAQQWDSPEALAIVARAVARRTTVLNDTTLRDFSARAHGFVMFLGQLGEGLSEPPRLIKADQLELEVYWRAPNHAKQRIIGWRGKPYLPTDIQYHRDHLGIVMGNFADRIRLGEGDEVRDVPHPLAPGDTSIYDFALVDSLEVASQDRSIRVYVVRFRPRDYSAPRLIGTLYIDVTYGDLVRMTFNFTRGAYLDPQLEDISVAIDNWLFEGRFWLPARQEIEIRRRATWLDFPARGIIRGHWDIDTYRFNQGLSDALFGPPGAPEIVAAPPEERAAYPWPDSLDAAVRGIATPATMRDFDKVRAEAQAVAMGHVLTRLKQTQIGGAAVSDFAHIDRVEGVAFGAGLTHRSANEANVVRLHAGVGTADGLVTGGATFTSRHGATTYAAAGFREVRDVGDVPVISRAVNSLLAQEFGADYGDYYLAAGGWAAATRALSGRTSLRLALGWEHVDSLLARYTWARGAFKRPNPGADAGGYTLLRLSLVRQPGSFATESELSGRVELEGATGAREYARGFAEARAQAPLGATRLVVRAAAGAASLQLPRQRAFVLGGRGTALGEAFRSRAGRGMAWTSVEWELPVPFPAIPLGSYGSVGRTATLAPWLAVGRTLWPVAGDPRPAGGASAVGLGLGVLDDLLRIDVGYGLESGRVAGAVDVSRVFWDIL